jgi:hypothetical protein
LLDTDKSCYRDLQYETNPYQYSHFKHSQCLHRHLISQVVNTLTKNILLRNRFMDLAQQEKCWPETNCW